MLRPGLFLTVWLVLGCLFHHVSGMEENPTPECEEDEYLSDDRTECHPCQELMCEAGFEPNLSCGGGNPLTGAACTRCQEGYFSNAGQNCQRCSVCRNTVNDVPCSRERDIKCGDCKEGYVFLGFHCRSCDQVPYPSHYEQCREEKPPSVEEPLPYTVVESAEKTSTEGKEESEPPWNSMLVIIILAGLILLVGLVIILGIVFCCHYKRNGHCGGARRSSPQDVERDEPGGNRQDEPTQSQGPNTNGGGVEDPLIRDIQPNLRSQANGPSDAHPSSSPERATLLGEANGSCNGQIPTRVETSVGIDDTDAGSYDELQNRQSHSRSDSHCSQSSKSSERRSNSQDHTSSQLCQGCSMRSTVHIEKADTVNFVTCSGGHHSSHPPSQAYGRGDKKYNREFNPSDN